MDKAIVEKIINNEELAEFTAAEWESIESVVKFNTDLEGLSKRDIIDMYIRYRIADIVGKEKFFHINTYNGLEEELYNLIEALYGLYN